MPVVIKYNSKTANSYLSNFFIEPDTTHVEGEYQAHKYADESMVQATIMRFMPLEPSITKSLGRKINCRPDWDQVKDTIMHLLILQKFKDHPELLERLLSTGSAVLVHDCPWGDTYWGMCRNRGLNKHGEITMLVRSELKDFRI